MIAVRVGTANIRNTPDMARAAVRRSAHIVGMHADVCGFQEIGEAEDHADVRTGLGTGWKVAPLTDTTECPIHYRASLLRLMDPLPAGIMSSGKQKAHDGLAHISPTRFTTWACLQSVRYPAIRFAVINLHTVSKPFDKTVARQRWREEMWYIHYAKFAEMANKFNDAGLTVLAVGDFNALPVPKTDKDFVWLFNSTIDKIGRLTGKTPVVLNNVSSFDTPSDHRLRVATVRLG